MHLQHMGLFSSNRIEDHSVRVRVLFVFFFVVVEAFMRTFNYVFQQDLMLLGINVKYSSSVTTQSKTIN
jgi:hypothetical protein